MTTRNTFSMDSIPGFVADPQSMDLYGGGVIVDFTAFTDASYGVAGRKVIPAGTRVELSAGKAVPLASGRPMLLVADAVENSRTAALSGYGAYTGGNVYKERLPGTVSGAEATALAPFFLLQTYNDVRQ